MTAILAALILALTGASGNGDSQGKHRHHPHHRPFCAIIVYDCSQP